MNLDRRVAGLRARTKAGRNGGCVANRFEVGLVGVTNTRKQAGTFPWATFPERDHRPVRAVVSLCDPPSYRDLEEMIV